MQGRTTMDTLFSKKVSEMVSQIPLGRVMTYGQVAALCGSPRAARIVGGIAHYGDPELPWHRVVNKNGGLASGYHGGRKAQKEHLEAEGVRVLGSGGNFKVDIDEILWRPKNNIEELYIVGPTASAKSSLAMKVAVKLSGEIVCADSQTLRKHLDIGTAKPTKQEQQKIPHHMLDIIEPMDQYSVAEFQKKSRSIIADIKKRAKLPIIVGGSGMYVDSLYYDYSIEERPSSFDKAELEQKSVEELQKIIKEHGWKLPENKQNQRHLVGLIMRGGEVKQDRKSTDSSKCMVGLMPDDETLKHRINSRVEQMFELGLVEETKRLLETFGTFPTSIDAIGYPIVENHIKGSISLQEAKRDFARGHWQYARKQKAWFKRNPNISWFTEKEAALKYIEQSMSVKRIDI